MSEQEKKEHENRKSVHKKNAPLMLHLVQADLLKKIYCTVEILSAPQIYAKERTTEHTHHTHQKLSFRLCLHRGGGGGGGGIGESGVVGAGGGGGGGGGEPTSLVLPEREPPASLPPLHREKKLRKEG